MAKRNPLNKSRSHAYTVQNGRCYYCRQPMWKNDPLEFAVEYRITLRQAKAYQCTGEHLTPHKDGGDTSVHNIVAACHYCNQHRHRGRKVEPTPEDYRDLVVRRMQKGGWHCARLTFAC